MKVNSIASRVNPNYFRRAENVQRTSNVTDYSMNVQPLRMITFAGKKADQVALVSAESKDYEMVGGVSTVLKDYPANVFGTEEFDEKAPLIIPYYNGQRVIEEDTTNKDDKKNKKFISATVLTKNGVPIYTKTELVPSSTTNNKTKIKTTKKVLTSKTNLLNPKNTFELEEIAKSKMDWNGQKVDIAAYKVKGRPHYMIYTPEMASMVKPYEKDFAKVAYGSTAKAGGEYAQFCKALVELLPKMEASGLNPKHILLNDAQTGYIPEFIAQKLAAGDEYYKDTKMSFVQHNLGEGYQQKMEKETAFRSFATNDMINTVEKDPEYIKAKLLDEGRNVNYCRESYFAPLVKPFLGTDGVPSASMVPVRYAKNNNLTHISSVAELYAQDCIDNPRVAVGLTEHLKELNKMGKVSGILNGRGYNDIDPSKPIGIGNVYNQAVTDNKGNIHQPFNTFNKDMSAKDIIKAKKQNAANLINRLQPGIDIKYSIAHAKGKGLIGTIDKKWADKLNNGENVTTFVFWGRADDQKGANNVLEAFARFAKTPEGKNSIIIAGGELEHQSSENIILRKLDEMGKDEELKGRFCYMDGFAPNAVLSSAGDAAVFPSRFAPCELTDLEAMRFGATPIVTNLQGLKQKNFDIRNPKEADKATGYKTDAHYYMDEKDVIARSEYYNKEKERLMTDQLKKLKLEDTPANRANIEPIVKGSNEYNFLWTIVTDELTTQDLVEAMKAKATETPEVTAKLIKNTMNTHIGWRDNNELHPENKSSTELYHERHLNGASTPATKSLFLEAAKDKMAEIKERVNKANVAFSGWQTKVTQMTTEAGNVVKEFLQNKSNRSFVSGILAALGIVGITAGTVTALNNNKEEQERPHASARIA